MLIILAVFSLLITCIHHETHLIHIFPLKLIFIDLVDINIAITWKNIVT